jgi:hypothetical protein
VWKLLLKQGLKVLGGLALAAVWIGGFIYTIQYIVYLMDGQVYISRGGVALAAVFGSIFIWMGIPIILTVGVRYYKELLAKVDDKGNMQAFNRRQWHDEGCPGYIRGGAPCIPSCMSYHKLGRDGHA